MYSIYKILFKKQVVYVGQTKSSIQKRFYSHCHGSKYRINKFIQKNGKENFSVVLIEKCINRKKASKKEKYWIKKLNTLYPSGCNISKGGHSIFWTKETRLKSSESKKRYWSSLSKKERKRPNVSKAKKEYWAKYSSEERKKLCVSLDNTGKKQSKETIEKRAKKLRGKKRPPFSEEWKRKIAEGGKGRTPWNKGKKLHYIPENAVKVLCLNNNIIYNSIHEAAKKLNVGYQHVWSVCKGNRNHTGGYRFEYAK